MPNLLRHFFLLLLFWEVGYAGLGQICTGSLGDPVVNIDFGRGQNPGPPLPPGVVSYTFTTQPCPQDGFYTVVNNTVGCFNNTWHTLNEDRTPNDVNGFMMLVNAGFAASDFYVDTVRGLCGGTTYEFAAWVVNVLRPTSCNGQGVTPNLRFTIETITGAVLGIFQSGDIASTNNPEWKQFGLFFKTPPNINNIVLRITNTNPGGCGNDLALDDITFRPCGPKVTTSFPNAVGSLINTCETNIASIDVVATLSTGFASPVYQWQTSEDNGLTWDDIPGATQLIFQRPPTPAGTYLYRIAVAEQGNMSIQTCRIVSNVLSIIVQPIPGQLIRSNSPVCEGQLIQLDVSTGVTFQWTGPNGFTATGPRPSLIATPNAAGIYSVTAIDGFGCPGANQTTVVVNAKPNVTSTPDTSFCEGVPVTLRAMGANQFRWLLLPDTTTKSNQATFTVSLPASTVPFQVMVIGSNALGCSDTAATQLTVLTSPKVRAGPDRSVFEGDSTKLEGTSPSINTRFYWQPTSYMNNPNILTPMVAPPGNFSYRIFAESTNGCGIASDEVLVTVYKKVSIPNVFSPNDDGINDNWEIRALESYPGCRVTVFDRYGKTIFMSTNYPTPWDGKKNGRPLPAGTYYYVIDLNLANRELKGSVTIIR